ncbi:helix-turn-helix domain-containing protein [Aerococcaceae bacterium NML191292]|nr:helix-turn-helix domain-containing protein [Aerococcaceae bacterium NML210727]MCW6655376.1 helix-turn-helix domain-containing protein [Aerococcaceae bacterium NML201296]MCW6660490.1 helix-turn-helix domain-containing protein [Aerococcaceae bacterium NML191292]MCW6660609.1 helix-turn-helix domain-containing protein [Aerococcaceae bacterium NML201209]
MDIDKKHVGLRIKSIRQNKGMNLEEFGKLFNVSKSNVSHWEAGNTLPNAERLKAIAKIGDISVDELLYGPIKEKILKSLFKLAPKYNFELTANNIDSICDNILDTFDLIGIDATILNDIDTIVTAEIFTLTPMHRQETSFINDKNTLVSKLAQDIVLFEHEKQKAISNEAPCDDIAYYDTFINTYRQQLDSLNSGDNQDISIHSGTIYVLIPDKNDLNPENIKLSLIFFKGIKVEQISQGEIRLLYQDKLESLPQLIHIVKRYHDYNVNISLTDADWSDIDQLTTS